MIQTILWDVDGTLLDFSAAERYGMVKCCKEIGVDMDDAMLADYSAINRSWWEKHERGEVTQKEIFSGRLIELFAKYGISYTDYDRFNERYQIALGEVAFPLDDSLRLLQELKGQACQYAVTNGSRTAQEAKLEKSGIGKLLDGVFISEKIGYQKPSKGFFDIVQKQTGYIPEQTLIVGDSLTSDMQGGNNAGIRCCWYNPKGAPAKDDVRIDFEIRNLWEVKEILK